MRKLKSRLIVRWLCFAGLFYLVYVQFIRSNAPIESKALHLSIVENENANKNNRADGRAEVVAVVKTTAPTKIIKVDPDDAQLHYQPKRLEEKSEDKNAPLRKKDWTDYKREAEEKQRIGPGEQGVGVVLSVDESKSVKKNTLFGENGFNALVSDKISLQRAVNDIRHPNCRKKTYLANLPPVSVIIPFHNEHLSTLLRSIYSIVNRTPPELLKEIILVDDFSSKNFLKKELDDYLKENFRADLVRIVRLKKREGLIRTRMAGANVAVGDILVFFDSHIECSTNWLPPLIEPIALNYTTAVCPFIDVINDETFAYSAQDEGARGAFDWLLFYKRLPLLNEPARSPEEPFDNPIMAGGLFAISKKWFQTLGGYDQGLEIWGGEQYELSFKIWQCGGRMVDAPCSRVGHIYRKFSPFSNVGVGDYLSKNYKRVADIWMDEYKEFIYNNRPHLRNVNAGDISQQLEIKKQLQCKSFKWFLENVAFDLVKFYPPVPPTPYASGQIQHIKSGLCIDTKFKKALSNFGLDSCHSQLKEISGEQKFELSWRSDMRSQSRNMCWDVSSSEPGASVLLYECHGYHGNQEFRYNTKTNQIVHPLSRQCLDCNADRKEIFMNPCDNSSHSQKWTFDHINATMIESDFKF